MKSAQARRLKQQKALEEKKKKRAERELELQKARKRDRTPIHDGLREFNYYLSVVGDD